MVELSIADHRLVATASFSVETVGKYSFVFAALSVLFFIMGFV